MLEPLVSQANNTPWLFSTPEPSLADISLYYQLAWGLDVAAGRGIENLTGGGTRDTKGAGVEGFNTQRYPGLTRWFGHIRDYLDCLPSKETIVTDECDVLQKIKACEGPARQPELLPTAAPQLMELDDALGLMVGSLVSAAPADTGRSSPTVGTLLAISPEEVVLRPQKEAEIEVNIHFPRIEFDIRPASQAKL
jgi:hypothetical protein